MKKILVIVLFMVLAVMAKSQSMTAWEIKWNFYGVRHEGLMILAGNTGTFRVKVIDRSSGELLDVVDQYVKAKSKSDGTVLNCYNPQSMSGSSSYSADNFFVSDDGEMFMMDDNGNWSAEVTITEISEMSDLLRMKKKYGL
jgi:hypothetical protein